MRRQWLGLAIAVALACGAGAAHALPIAIAAHERRVAAEGESDTGYVSAADSTAALGHASLEAIAPPRGQGVWALGLSNLESELSTSQISATAAILTSANAPAGEFRMSTAEALYRVEFTPTQDVSLRLFGSLDWNASGPAQSVAFVELSSVDTAVDPLLLHFAIDGPETAASFDEIAALRAGVAYRLVGFARGGSDAFGDEAPGSYGGFELTLAEVPEPGTALLVAGGIALLGRRGRRR